MTVLEQAVSDLADALESLESKLEDSIDSHRAARRQATAARQHAANANKGLAAAIVDVKALLETDHKSERP